MHGSIAFSLHALLLISLGKSLQYKSYSNGKNSVQELPSH